MKKFAFALTCIAIAFATLSCAKKTNDPDAINLKKYNPQDDPSCWAVTIYQGNSQATTYSWANEYTIALEIKASLEKIGSKTVSYSWEKVKANNEQTCEAKNR